MKGMRIQIVIASALISVGLSGALAQAQESPVVGRRAAEKYMGVRPDTESDEIRRPADSGGGGTSNPHYMMLHLGTFVSDDAYSWGARGHTSDVGDWTMGVTYKMGEWVNSMDFLIRLDFATFDAGGEKPKKISFLPMIMFPDSSSRFPIYFGAGLGPGVFLKQARDESQISLDYQVVMGVRFFDIVGDTGFFLETGIKNHVHLLSDGQFNGTFISVGSVFSF